MNHEATIATLNMQLDNCAKDLYEKDKRIADLERQLAEASAPAVEQHSPAVVAWAVTSDNTKGIHKLSIKRESADRKAAVWLEEWPNNPVRVRPLAFADTAPQAADTDKVREAIRDVEVSTSGSKGYAKAFNDGAETMREAIAGIFDFMAAQAPVREVPGGWKLVPIEPTDEMRAACINACYADHIDEDWAAMLAAAPLPAAPVQQEGV